jgi:redox-sensitive bicupin YhaK (pirin superfamily)
MLTVRRAADRGQADYGWLDSRHTFSFGEYYDPHHMGFRALRVINDDRVAAGQGFGTHPHRDMEIISYVVEGALEHRDSMGTGSVIRPGDVQRMSAGTGVTHSEYNASKSEPVHFLQIWVVPDVRGLAPSYEQRHFAPRERRGTLRVVASPDGRDGSVSIHNDVVLYAGLFDEGERAVVSVAPPRMAWVQIVGGEARVNGTALAAGDGAALSDETQIQIEGLAESELLLFDLA